MIRNNNPSWIKEWQTETADLFKQTQFFGYYLIAEMTMNGVASPPLRVALLNQSAGNIAFLKGGYPTVVNNKQLNAISFSYQPVGGAAVSPISFLGYNSLFYESTTGFSPTGLFNAGPSTMMKLFKTNYFFIRKINTTSIDVFALDKDGKEIITGTIKL